MAEYNGISFDHRHYCEEKLFCYKKKNFCCDKNVKYRNAGHDDRCDECDRMITVYFDENNKALFLNRIYEFVTRSAYDDFCKANKIGDFNGRKQL